MENQAIQSIKKLLGNEKLRQLCREYAEQKSKFTDTGFNVFTLISDLYHRENLHSDILAFLLNPKESHGQGRAFFDCFIDFLVKAKPKLNGSLVKANFRDYEVTREEGRIDVGVFDNASKKAIIIENKINRAEDMDKQLPRYVEYASERQYKVLAAVYISPDIRLSPDCTTWNEVEIKKMQEILIPVIAYAPDKLNMAEAFIPHCVGVAEKCDVLSMLRQYGVLLKIIGRNAMNYNQMAEFYELITEAEVWETAQLLPDMLGKIPQLLSWKITQEVKKLDPKQQHLRKLKPVGDNVYLQIEQAGVTLHVDIGFCKDKTQVELSIGDQSEDNFNISEKLRALIDSSPLKGQQLKRAEWGRYVRYFKFPAEEEELFALLRMLLSPKLTIGEPCRVNKRARPNQLEN